MARKKAWSKNLEVHGVHCRIYDRGGVLWFAWSGERGRSRNGRRSLKTKDRVLAEQVARNLAADEARGLVTGVSSDKITIGQLFAAYSDRRMPKLSAKMQKWAATTRDLFLRAWGADELVQNIDQTRVDEFARERMSAILTPDEGGRKVRGKIPAKGGRKPRAVKASTVQADLRWLSSVLNWGRGFRVNGKPMLVSNPLDTVERPKDQNIRRPRASVERYTATLPHTNTIDDTGRLRLALVLVRFQGHRISATLSLNASDLLLTPERIREALAAIGEAEADVDEMPHGAILWQAAHDKIGRTHITPMHSTTREEVEGYLRQNPKLGDAPLFPADGAPHVRLRSDVASRWLRKAEGLAQLPKLEGGVWHPYRRLFATRLRHLPDIDAARAGGWKTPQAMKLSYQQAEASGVLRAIESA